MLNQARQLLSTAVHYFNEAIRLKQLDPVLHSNIGLAYMLRNAPKDVEHALRHWQIMRRGGGEWAERRFQQMLSVMHSDETARAEFDDVTMALRPIDSAECIICLPPRVGPPMYAVTPIIDRVGWQLETSDPNLQQALSAHQRLQQLDV